MQSSMRHFGHNKGRTTILSRISLLGTYDELRAQWKNDIYQSFSLKNEG